MSAQPAAPVETDSPRDTTAVIVSGQANLIYVHKDGYICVLTARIGSEEQRSRDNERYIATAPRIDGRSVQCRARHPRVASVAYFHEFTDEIWRIYYIDYDNFLCEIKSDGNGGWEKGALDKSRIQVEYKSILAAVTDDDCVKVYFQPLGQTSIFVTWSPKGQVGAWARPSQISEAF